MQKNKLYSLLLAVCIAFGLWLYVVTNVSQGDDKTFYNIPVVLEGESLLTEQNLMITSVSTRTVSLHLSGTRSDLNKIGNGNTTVRVDVSGIAEPGEHSLAYIPSYPTDVASNALVVESRSPSGVTVTVDYRRTKEIPVEVRWMGSRSESYLYDTENATLDNNSVTIVGPAAVVDQIDHAVIEVDLTDRTGSMSQSFRYTLCDAENNPVNAEQITTSVEEVRVDLQIQRIKVVELTVDLNYGGGATQENTTVDIQPKTIRVSGSEAVLADVGDTYSVGTINLAELEGTKNDLTYTVNMPEGVTNQTGVSEVTVSVTFSGLRTRELTIDNIQGINVPEGLEAEIINTNLTVKVRGPQGQVEKLTEDDITAVVDFSNAEVGTATYKASIRLADGFAGVGAMRTYSVSATVSAGED